MSLPIKLLEQTMNYVVVLHKVDYLVQLLRVEDSELVEIEFDLVNQAAFILIFLAYLLDHLNLFPSEIASPLNRLVLPDNARPRLFRSATIPAVDILMTDADRTCDA